MIFALKNGERIEPTPKDKALCPICNEEVIAKCGSIKVWHWSHRSLNDCDTWSEGETEWHKSWKDNFPKEQQEVVIGKHRADVKLHSGMVVELQNSPISAEEIKEREKYYAEMIWLLNGETLGKNIFISKKDNYCSFKWNWFPKSWSFSNKTIYIDLNYLKEKYEKELEEYDNGKKHYSTIKTCSYEWEDDYGNIREGDYPHYSTESFEDTEEYVKNLLKRYFESGNQVFQIKKIYPQGTGWGVLLTKEEFLKQLK